MHQKLIELNEATPEYISVVVTNWDDTTAQEVARDIIRRYNRSRNSR